MWSGQVRHPPVRRKLRKETMPLLFPLPESTHSASPLWKQSATSSLDLPSEFGLPPPSPVSVLRILYCTNLNASSVSVWSLCCETVSTSYFQGLAHNRCLIIIANWSTHHESGSLHMHIKPFSPLNNHEADAVWLFMCIKYAINFIEGEIPSKNVASSCERTVSVQCGVVSILKSQLGHVYELERCKYNFVLKIL